MEPHPLQYAGEGASVEAPALGQDDRQDGADAVVITSPASIAWLFNIRGGDVHARRCRSAKRCCTPTARADLFLAGQDGSAELRTWLGNEVALKTLADIEPAFEA